MNAFITPIRNYNIETTTVSKKEWKMGDISHRNHLRRIIQTKPYEQMKNDELYKITGQLPLSITATERRTKMLGKVLRLPKNTPPNIVMKEYFEQLKTKKKRVKITGGADTLPDQLNYDLKITLSKAAKEQLIREFPEKNIAIDDFKLENLSDLERMRNLAMDRKFWKRLVEMIVEQAIIHNYNNFGRETQRFKQQRQTKEINRLGDMVHSDIIDDTE